MTFKLPDNVSTMEAVSWNRCRGYGYACEPDPNASWERRQWWLGAGVYRPRYLMSLKARGVSEIYVADVLDKRLEKARELGATRVFNSRNENIEEFVKTLPGGGVDQVYECAGNRITTLQTCRLIKRAGKITLVGVRLSRYWSWI